MFRRFPFGNQTSVCGKFMKESFQHLTVRPFYFWPGVFRTPEAIRDDDQTFSWLAALFRATSTGVRCPPCISVKHSPGNHGFPIFQGFTPNCLTNDLVRLGHAGCPAWRVSRLIIRKKLIVDLFALVGCDRHACCEMPMLRVYSEQGRFEPFGDLVPCHPLW